MTSRSFGLAVVAVMLMCGFSRAEQAEDRTATDESKLPIKRVVMFSSGVGYFQHQGKVDGDASIDLKFRTENINDLLKSMVLEDRGGGQISTVTYGSRDPITRTLKTFSIDLTTNPTLALLIEQMRGEQVDIEAPNHIVGTIVGVEHHKKSAGEKQVVDMDFLNLLTDRGLVQIEWDSISRIKLVNPQLDAELREALKVLAAGHSADKKTVSLKFLGKGERDVRVGYIQEAPVWKTSYRLVLDEKEKAFLQGWAIVENTTDTDWKDVRLSLVSGRPISFVMDLYSPLYATRATVVPELFASLMPQVYEQNPAESVGERLTAPGGGQHDRAKGARPATARPKSQQKSRQLNDSMGGGQGGSGGGGGEFGRGAAANADYSQATADFDNGLERATTPAAARGGEVGELFQYDIKNPVTLARLRSAMLPIVNESIECEKVSIYNPAVNPKHPLNGVQLTNTSKLHLMQGPITVFDGGVYAGDGQISDLPPGAKRLLSYAMDLDIEVAPENPFQSPGSSQWNKLLSARFDKGVFVAESKSSQTQKFTVKKSGSKPKTVLIEYPIYKGWKLVTPREPTETTREFYRFAVLAKPNEPTELKIEREQLIHQTISLSTLDINSLQFYISAEVVPESAKQTLREIAKRRNEIVEIGKRTQQLEQDISTIGQEQDRIRQNMAQIAKNSDLYNRYIKKFTDQEDQVEKHRESIRELTDQANKAQQALDEYVKGLKNP